MKLRNQSGSKLQNGLSLIELLALLAVVAFVAFLLVYQFSSANRRAPRIGCVSNLKNIGLSFRIFATDNGDQFPPAVIVTNEIALTSIRALEVFRFMSNELSTPGILHCYSDVKRKPSTEPSFKRLTSKNISYFASLSASETNPAAILAGDRNIVINGKPVTSLLTLTTNLASTLSFSKEMHVEQGNICMADGSVQQMSSSRLKLSIRDQDMQTNHLVFP